MTSGTATIRTVRLAVVDHRDRGRVGRAAVHGKRVLVDARGDRRHGRAGGNDVAAVVVDDAQRDRRRFVGVPLTFQVLRIVRDGMVSKGSRFKVQ